MPPLKGRASAPLVQSAHNVLPLAAGLIRLEPLPQPGGESVGGVVVELAAARPWFCRSMDRVHIHEADAEDVSRAPHSVPLEQPTVVGLLAITAAAQQAADKSGLVVVVLHEAGRTEAADSTPVSVPVSERHEWIAFVTGSVRGGWLPCPAGRLSCVEALCSATLLFGESGVAYVAQVDGQMPAAEVRVAVHPTRPATGARLTRSARLRGRPARSGHDAFSAS